MALTGDFTATAISATVRAGTNSATDAVTESLERIAALDPGLNAFVLVRAAKALAEAAALDGRQDLSRLPLAGVPVAIKDNVAVAGEPMRNGSPATSAELQTADHPVVARLRAAGAIVVGITAVPELCIWGSTDSPEVLTRNPWNTDRTPGGSSGGSAVAVASGMVPIAHGADGMGSIRVPAACCRLFGIKPGRGVVPAELGLNSWFGVAENGSLATTVEDAALMLSVLAGDSDLAEIGPVEHLRLGIAVGSPLAPLPTSRRWIEATTDLAAMLNGLGHLTTPHRFRYPVIAPIARWTAGTAVDARGLDRRLLQPRTRTQASVGNGALRLNLVKDSQAAGLEARMRRVFEDIDAVITPALAMPPALLSARSRKSWLRNTLADIHFAPYSAQWNVLGWPAASVPVGWDAVTRTPLAVQIAAPPGGESLILSIAELIQRHRPWPRVAPGQ